MNNLLNIQLDMLLVHLPYITNNLGTDTDF